MSRLSDLASWASRHRRLLGVVQLVLLAAFFVSLGWALRGTVHSAARDLDNANLVLFGLGCAALGSYYLVFVFGWMRILAEWGIELSYPAALRAEMVSMLAKYIPGGIWTPAARVVAARRAGVTDAALVTSSMLLEAGLSAVSGVIVFVVGLPFVDEVHAPLVPARPLRCRARGARPAARLPPARREGAAALRLHEELPNMRARTLTLLLVFYAGHVGARRLRALAAAALGRRASRGRRRSSSSAERPRSARSSPSSSSSRPRGSGRARRRCTGCCSPSRLRDRPSARSR